MSSTPYPVALVANITATNTTGNGGYFTVWPTGAPVPTTSDLNWLQSQSVPNLTIVSVSPIGDISIYNAIGNSDLLVDVVGWFG